MYISNYAVARCVLELSGRSLFHLAPSRAPSLSPLISSFSFISFCCCCCYFGSCKPKASFAHCSSLLWHCFGGQGGWAWTRTRREIKEISKKLVITLKYEMSNWVCGWMAHYMFCSKNLISFLLCLLKKKNLHVQHVVCCTMTIRRIVEIQKIARHNVYLSGFYRF